MAHIVSRYRQLRDTLSCRLIYIFFVCVCVCKQAVIPPPPPLSKDFKWVFLDYIVYEYLVYFVRDLVLQRMNFLLHEIYRVSRMKVRLIILIQNYVTTLKKFTY